MTLGKACGSQVPPNPTNATVAAGDEETLTTVRASRVACNSRVARPSHTYPLVQLTARYDRAQQECQSCLCIGGRKLVVVKLAS